MPWLVSQVEKPRPLQMILKEKLILRSWNYPFALDTNNFTAFKQKIQSYVLKEYLRRVKWTRTSAQAWPAIPVEVTGWWADGFRVSLICYMCPTSINTNMYKQHLSHFWHLAIQSTRHLATCFNLTTLAQFIHERQPYPLCMDLEAQNTENLSYSSGVSHRLPVPPALYWQTQVFYFTSWA